MNRNISSSRAFGSFSLCRPNSRRQWAPLSRQWFRRASRSASARIRTRVSALRCSTVFGTGGGQEASRRDSSRSGGPNCFSHSRRETSLRWALRDFFWVRRFLRRFRFRCWGDSLGDFLVISFLLLPLSSVDLLYHGKQKNRQPGRAGGSYHGIISIQYPSGS